jgi:hypothetical protein
VLHFSTGTRRTFGSPFTDLDGEGAPPETVTPLAAGLPAIVTECEAEPSPEP